MQTVKTILMNSGDALKTWTVLHDACHAKNIDLHSRYAQPTFVQGIVTQQIGCMFDALNTGRRNSTCNSKLLLHGALELLRMTTELFQVVSLLYTGTAVRGTMEPRVTLWSSPTHRGDKRRFHTVAMSSSLQVRPFHSRPASSRSLLNRRLKPNLRYTRQRQRICNLY